MVSDRDDRQKTHIVDIAGLAAVLLCSESMILKTWKQYPHFYIGHGCTAKGARFDVYDVIGYLKKRDYAKPGQKDKAMDRERSEDRVSQESQKGVQNKVCSQRMGKNNVRQFKKSQTDRFNLCGGIN